MPRRLELYEKYGYWCFYSINLALYGSFISIIPAIRGSREQIREQKEVAAPMAISGAGRTSGSYSLTNAKVFALAAVSRLDNEKLPVNV
jgi:hypothetical protein